MLLDSDKKMQLTLKTWQPSVTFVATRGQWCDRQMTDTEKGFEGNIPNMLPHNEDKQLMQSIWRLLVTIITTMGNNWATIVANNTEKSFQNVIWTTWWIAFKFGVLPYRDKTQPMYKIYSITQLKISCERLQEDTEQGRSGDTPNAVAGDRAV